MLYLFYVEGLGHLGTQWMGCIPSNKKMTFTR
jgi:hypothetical protein